MARIFVTGSSAGLGLLSSKYLLARGHQVVLHARSAARAADIRQAEPKVADIVIGDLETLAGMHQVAEGANACGPFDAVIHNAGVGEQGAARLTCDGLPLVFAVNALAPYVLTARITRPARLVYLSSSMHFAPDAMEMDKLWKDGPSLLSCDYSQSKFLVTLLAFAVARWWPNVHANAVDPGWVPTRMGGVSAPDDLQLGCETQSWLAEGGSTATGEYFHHRRMARPDPATQNPMLQRQFLALCERISETPLCAA